MTIPTVTVHDPAIPIEELYRLWWTTDRDTCHSPAMPYEHALTAYDAMVHHVTRYHHPVHLVTEAAWRELVAAHARKALAS